QQPCGASKRLLGGSHQRRFDLPIAGTRIGRWKLAHILVLRILLSGGWDGWRLSRLDIERIGSSARLANGIADRVASLAEFEHHLRRQARLFVIQSIETAGNLSLPQSLQEGRQIS